MAALASEGSPLPRIGQISGAREAGLRIAVVTSSKNGEAVPEAADLISTSRSASTDSMWLPAA